MEKLPQISIVIPLYNEEKVFDKLIGRINAVIQDLSFAVEVVLVNDGSRDRTAELMYHLALSDGRYHAVFLSRNHGHQLAVSAGMASARGTEGIMIMDGDLQDPPELISKFYDEMKAGNEVIYAIRKKRKEGPFKRFAYWAYYRLQKQIANLDIPLDSGDFSMMSRRVVNELNAMPERSRYIRGMRTWVGFKQKGIEYERDGRAAGEAKYTLKKLMQLAFNGIFNFSEFPVKIITRLGLLTILLSTIYIGYVLIKKIFFGPVPEGFLTTVVAITLFSGVQLIALGLIGEYVLRIYDQVRNRPLFIIDKKIIDKTEVSGEKLLP